MGTWSGTGVASGRGADRPPEDRGLERDGVRLLVSTSEREETRTFRDLPMLLHPGDLLVVNESATLRASLPARAPWGDFLLNLSTHYGSGLWLSEPRWATDRPGPLPLEMGMVLDVGGISCEVVAPFPGIPRLVFLQADRDLDRAMERVGRPIRYG
ncbi:MAG TPA: S-adenosylmethionine:tRNA ribosyltransferase-isomerase, partial [Thermoplasmata archaeon]|nr:S-adenosylmethionine:tRNA ribosyltransferase-isomerase [Thermoplasmata archaeon]